MKKPIDTPMVYDRTEDEVRVIASIDYETMKIKCRAEGGYTIMSGLSVKDILYPTGFYDKKDWPIYDSHIVKIDDRLYGEIYTENGYPGILIHNFHGDDKIPSSDFALTRSFARRCEIVGTIYQHDRLFDLNTKQNEGSETGKN